MCTKLFKIFGNVAFPPVKMPKNVRQSCEPNLVIKPMKCTPIYIIMRGRKIKSCSLSHRHTHAHTHANILWTSNSSNEKRFILTDDTLPDKNLTKIHASRGVSEWWYKCNHVSCDFFFFSTKKIVSANSVNFDK